MQLIPRHPLQRLHWRLTGLFILGASMTAALLHILGSLFVAYLLFSSANLTNELEDVLREKESEVLPFFDGNAPNRAGLMRLLDQTVLMEDTKEGLQFQFFTATLGRFHAAIADEKGEILASSPDDKTFPQGKPLNDFLTPTECALITEARAGVFRAIWNRPRIIAAGPIRRDGKLLGYAFVRSDPLYSATTWRTFAGTMLSSLVVNSIGAALIGGVVGWIIARSVTRRLLAISGAADSWASGDLTATAPEKPADELGLLAARLNRMADDLQQVITLRNTLAALEERQRITRDLHDTIKQEAFATAMMVGSAQQCLVTDDREGMRRALNEVALLSRQMQTDLSGILAQMRTDTPPTLAERLENIIGAWQRRTEIELRWENVGREVATNSTNAEQVTRIAEEALANAVKHSHATQISMTLTGNGTTQRLTITDNGRGFDLGSAATDSTGLGLRTMQERADLLPNGRLFIEAIPNHGTTIQLQWEEKTA